LDKIGNGFAQIIVHCGIFAKCRMIALDILTSAFNLCHARQDFVLLDQPMPRNCDQMKAKDGKKGIGTKVMDDGGETPQASVRWHQIWPLK
jgi:hypothetical protein